MRVLIVVAWLGAIAAGVATASVTAGCAGAQGSILGSRAQGMQEALNSTAQMVNPVLRASVIACDGAEGMVVARQGSTKESDLQDIAKIRAACDRVFEAFDLVRAAHEQAQSFLDIVAHDPTQENIQAASELLKTLQEKVLAAQSLWVQVEAALRKVIYAGIQ
jgi:hypothetical protein